MTLRLHLVHQPHLLRGDGQVLALRGNDAALLALVALDGPLPRARVAGLLWPGAGGDDAATADKRALNNLRQRLFRIGRFCGRELVVGGHQLMLAEGVEHDLSLARERFLAEPQAARGELLGQDAYDHVAELGEWVLAARQRWRSARADALLGLITSLETEGRLGEAVLLANRLVADEPLMEHASRLLMRLHYRRGDRGAAMTEFERLRQSLFEHTGDAPSGETIELSLTIGRDDAPTPGGRAPPLALRHPPRTVGREQALLQAQRCWDERGVVLVTGGAGIGKSRLLADLLQRWQVPLHWRCLPESAASNLGLLRALATLLAPRLRERLAAETAAWLDWLVDPGQRPSPVQPVNRGQLVALGRPILRAAVEAGVAALAVDDLHHADSASVDVVCAWIDEGAGDAAAPRWLLACRDHALPAPLQAWLDRQALDAYPAVALAPLDLAATQVFLAGLGVAAEDEAAARRLHRHCGGHPLFMLQVLRQLQSQGQLDAGAWPEPLPLPEDAMLAASQRLSRVEPDAQQLAFVGALCGADFSAPLMCRLLKKSATELVVPWRRLEELHVFGAQGFAHDLIREAVLQALPQTLAPLLHREIAQALADGDADPVRRGQHWEHGGEPARAAADFEDAARTAQACGLDVSAVAWWQRAAHNHRAAGQLGDAFACLWRAGHLTLASASLQDAQALAEGLQREAVSGRERAMASELLARVQVEQQDPRALDSARQALALADAAAP